MLPLADNQLLTSLMLLAGSAMLTFFLLRRNFRYFKRNRASQDNSPIAKQPRPTGEWSGAYKDSSAMIDRQMVELHNSGRELKAQLDNKIVVMQELCAKSQRQIDRLEELLREIDAKR